MVRTFRTLLCWAMIVFLPLALAAEDQRAVLYATGQVWLNNAPVSGPSAISPGSDIQTFPGTAANIVLTGSNVIIRPDSIVNFRGSFLILRHGAVEIQTSTRMAVHADCVQVTPAASEMTQFEVTDVNWTAHIVAVKNDVDVSQSATAVITPEKVNGLKHTTLSQGQSLDRDDHCKGDTGPKTPNVASSHPYIIWGGAAAGGLILLCELLHCWGSNPPEPISPWKPCSTNVCN